MMYKIVETFGGRKGLRDIAYFRHQLLSGMQVDLSDVVNGAFRERVRRVRYNGVLTLRCCVFRCPGNNDIKN